jgi:tetratricopeptide (TPR) repeat protein
MKDQHQSNDDVKLELAIVKQLTSSARCRIIGTDDIINLKTRIPLTVIQGEILTVEVVKRWKYRNFENVSGKIVNRRLDAKALDLIPLKLLHEHLWDPKEHYWGEDDEPLEEWAEPIFKSGKRPSFEMEQIIPGFNPEKWEMDPITEAVELKNAGYLSEARERLEDMIEKDPRCIDAYSHLGTLVFDVDAKWARNYYELGVKICELSFEKDFNGVLPWGMIDNRPFLRCLHGYGLCLWRLGHFKEAEAVFNRMLWLNPTDNQGARFIIEEVQDKVKWENSQC